MAELHLKANNIYFMALGNPFWSNNLGHHWPEYFYLWFMEQPYFLCVCSFIYKLYKYIIYFPNHTFLSLYYCKYFCWSLLFDIILNTSVIKTTSTTLKLYQHVVSSLYGTLTIGSAQVTFIEWCPVKRILWLKMNCTLGFLSPST